MIDVAHDYLADLADDFFNDRPARPFEATLSGAAWCAMRQALAKARSGPEGPSFFERAAP
jgi:hypothetical protein